MNVFLTAALALIGLLLGAYVVAVLDRVLVLGPSHVWLALARPALEAWSLLHQEDLTPRDADVLLFRSAPLVALVSAALAALALPVGPHLVGLDSPIGLFYFVVLLGPFVVTLMNAGWGQHSRDGLFGAFRAAAHLVSYEVPLGFAAIGPAMAAQSLSPTRIVEAQSHLWFGAWQPLGLLIYLIAALMATYRHPFDLPQAGSELEGGILSECSGPQLLIFTVALDGIYALVIAMAVILFLGGWSSPVGSGVIPFVVKALVVAFLTSWVGRRLPRSRVDQLLGLSWKILLPASLLNVAIVGILILALPGAIG